MLTIWDVLERARTGKRMEEKEFGLRIFRKVKELVKEHGISYDPDNPIPQDKGMADDVFQAAIEFYVDVGSYCINTKRVIQFTEEEIKEAMKDAPSEIVVGEGKDAVKLVHRDVEGDQDCVVCAGLQTLLYSDEQTMFNIYKACAKDRCVDGLWAGIVPSIENKYEVIAGTPSEIYPYKRGTEILRKAIAAAGRPGMHIMNNAPSSFATIAMDDKERGLRPCDPHMATGITEMKVSYDDFNRVVQAKLYGAPIHGSHSAAVQGFSGSPEGTAIVCVAGGLQSLMAYQADVANLHVIHISKKSRQAREVLWAEALALMALSRNSHLIIDGSQGDHPEAGPGTKQYFYESGAGHIVSTVCGGHSCEGTRKFVIGQTLNYGTPLESRWMGEVCKSSVGLKLGLGNEIVKELLKRYEGNIGKAPAGYVYEQLYDVEKVEPKKEYLHLYNEVKEEFESLGFKFRSSYW